MDWTDWRDHLCSPIWCLITKNGAQWNMSSTTPFMVICDKDMTPRDIISTWPDNIDLVTGLKINYFYFHSYLMLRIYLNIKKGYGSTDRWPASNQPMVVQIPGFSTEYTIDTCFWLIVFPSDLLVCPPSIRRRCIHKLVHHETESAHHDLSLFRLK